MSPIKDVTLCRIISNKVRQLREIKYPEHGGQKKCAEQFGVGLTTWNGWEAGRNIPSDKNQRKIAAFFKISVSELRGETTTPFRNEKTSTQSVEAGKLDDDTQTLLSFAHNLSLVLNTLIVGESKGIVAKNELLNLVDALTTVLEKSPLTQNMDTTTKKIS